MSVKWLMLTFEPAPGFVPAKSGKSFYRLLPSREAAIAVKHELVELNLKFVCRKVGKGGIGLLVVDSSDPPEKFRPALAEAQRRLGEPRGRRRYRDRFRSSPNELSQLSEATEGLLAHLEDHRLSGVPS